MRHPTTRARLLLALGAVAAMAAAGQDAPRPSVEEMAEIARARIKEREAELKARIAFEMGNLKLPTDAPAAQKSVKALRGMGDAAVPALLEALRSASENVRRNAALALRAIGEGRPEPPGLQTLRAILAQKDHPGRLEALIILEGGAPVEVLPLVRGLLEDAALDPGLRIPALLYLARAGHQEDGARIVPHLRHESGTVRRAALTALAALKATAALPDVARALDDPDPVVAQEAFRTLGAWKDPRATVRLLEIMDGADEDRARTAIRTLGEIGDPSVLPRLREKLRHPSQAVVEEAAYALGCLKDLSGEGPLTAPERAALRRTPRVPELHEALARKYKKLADCSGNAGLYQKAAREYKAILDIGGQRREPFTVLVDLAACHARMGDFKTAALTLRRTNLEEFPFLKDRPDFAEMAQDPRYRRMFGK